MKKDCHTHPNVLNNPAQTDSFIQKAVSLGLDEIYFTDHMPYSLTGYEYDRIPAGRVGDYCKKVRDIGEKYKDIITVRCGIEIDFHPDYTREIESVLEAGDFDYVLGSSHLHISGYGYDFSKISAEEYAEAVLKNYLCAARSGYFSILTHLDYYRRTFSELGRDLSKTGFDASKMFEPLLRELFSEMEKRGTALEINAAPLYQSFESEPLPYPHPTILSVAKDYDLRYTYGSDAHTADKVGYGLKKAAAIIKNQKI